MERKTAANLNREEKILKNFCWTRIEIARSLFEKEKEVEKKSEMATNSAMASVLSYALHPVHNDTNYHHITLYKGSKMWCISLVCFLNLYCLWSGNNYGKQTTKAHTHTPNEGGRRRDTNSNDGSNKEQMWLHNGNSNNIVGFHAKQFAMNVSKRCGTRDEQKTHTPF